MRRVSPLISMFTFGAAWFFGGCAEGTKVDLPGAVEAGGANTSVGAGGRAATGSGGATSAVRGGAVGSGGKSANSTNGGATSTSVTSGGAATANSGGATTLSSGGSLSTAGSSTVGSGGTSLTTVAAPVDGLGIKMAEKQSVDGNNVKSSFVLVNQGTTAVDLTKIKIRYYFTMDSWATPVLETYYAGSAVGSANVKGEFFTVALPGADRYVEISFIPSSTIVAPSLPASSQLTIQTGLHDQNWKAPDTSNDYSFTGALVGFTDRVTVFASGVLVWGVEPGSSTQTGAGGASGGGASGFAGASSEAAGSSGMAGSAATSSGGTAGGSSIEVAGANSGGMGSAGSAGAEVLAGAAGTAGSI